MQLNDFTVAIFNRGLAKQIEAAFGKGLPHPPCSVCWSLLARPLSSCTCCRCWGQLYCCNNVRRSFLPSSPHCCRLDYATLLMQPLSRDTAAGALQVNAMTAAPPPSFAVNSLRANISCGDAFNSSQAIRAVTGVGDVDGDGMEDSLLSAANGNFYFGGSAAEPSEPRHVGHCSRGPFLRGGPSCRGHGGHRRTFAAEAVDSGMLLRSLQFFPITAPPCPCLFSSCALWYPLCSAATAATAATNLLLPFPTSSCLDHGWG